MSEKHFNTAGPVNMAEHYKLAPLTRWKLDDVMDLINDKKYFLLHAPRQSGKTSCLLALRDKLNAEDKYICIYANIESARGAKDDLNLAISAIINELSGGIEDVVGYDTGYEELGNEFNSTILATARLNKFLRKLSIKFDKPLVLLIDEIDSMHGDIIISVLSQLRAGYINRGKAFPCSIMLTGVLDIKDYRLLNIDPKHITGGSCFNIKSESLTIGNFSRKEVEKLYLEHTKETGQIFEDAVFDLVYDLTDGQPWLVNALAFEVCSKMKENRDRSIAITAEIIEVAKENLILSRQTHLDQLADKLRQERVYRVINPMFCGDDAQDEKITDFDEVNQDQQYCIDLGFIKRTKKGLVIANKIYQEVLPRELVFPMQEKFLTFFNPEWVNEDQSLNTEKLFSMFSQFWRENSEIWSQKINGYKEAAPQLVFQAYLQRVANGHGRIDREYGLGTKRTDLYLKWNSPTGEQRIVIELKVRTKRYNTDAAFDKFKTKGLIQTAKYADKCNPTESHLIFFDRRDDVNWNDKIYTENIEQNGYKIKIWGM